MEIMSFEQLRDLIVKDFASLGNELKSTESVEEMLAELDWAARMCTNILADKVQCYQRLRDAYKAFEDSLKAEEA